jgi:hypothetical protein
MRVKQDIISSKISDFQIGERTFEIGGKNKGQQQITGAKEGYIVKDDIETGSSGAADFLSGVEKEIKIKNKK